MILDHLERLNETDQLPSTSDVVIVGGGVAGITTALFLAEAGLSVTVCEKGVVGGEQSARNWGWVRQMGRDPIELPLSIESLRLWRSLDDRYGIDTGFRSTGITYVCRTPAEIRDMGSWESIGRDAGLPCRLLDRRQLAELLPGLAPDVEMGLYTANDGRAEPLRAVPQLALAARRMGARIVETCAVRGVETQGGRLSAVVTEAGTVRTSTVVVAGGAWSRLFLGNLGINFPQLRVQGTAARVEIDHPLPDMPVGGGDFAFRKRLDGGYTVARRNSNVAPITTDSFRLFFDFLPALRKNARELSLSFGRAFLDDLKTPRRWALDAATPFEAVRTLDPEPVARTNRIALTNLAQSFAGFEGARITHQWAGTMDATPDAIPAIGPVDAIPGLFIASGFSGHGLGIGPGAGRLMAELIRGVTPCVDPEPFRLSRFRSACRQAA